MNSRDIETARKLIAQFEDKADGRHNSSLDGRETEHKTGHMEAPSWVLPASVQQAMQGLTRNPDLPSNSVPEHLLEMYRQPSRVVEPLALKEHWNDCGIGDYCKVLPDYALFRDGRMLIGGVILDYEAWINSPAGQLSEWREFAFYWSVAAWVRVK